MPTVGNLCSFWHKALAPFLAATTDQVSPLFGRHAGTKAMLAFAGAFGGLVSALHRSRRDKKIFGRPSLSTERALILTAATSLSTASPDYSHHPRSDADFSSRQPVLCLPLRPPAFSLIPLGCSLPNTHRRTLPRLIPCGDFAPPFPTHRKKISAPQFLATALSRAASSPTPSQSSLFAITPPVKSSTKKHPSLLASPFLCAMNLAPCWFWLELIIHFSADHARRALQPIHSDEGPSVC